MKPSRAGLARVLDEALNALDPDGERDVLTGLVSMSTRPTSVIVAHRPETSTLCERVIRLAQQHPALIDDQDQARYEMPA